jgi:hypothetical protein
MSADKIVLSSSLFWSVKNRRFSAAKGAGRVEGEGIWEGSTTRVLIKIKVQENTHWELYDILNSNETKFYAGAT